MTLLGDQERAAAGSTTAGLGGIYGTPQRDMVGYGSHAPDPKWPGGVSGPVTSRLELASERITFHLQAFAPCFESFFFFCPSHLLSSPFYSLSLLLILIVVTQIRGHIAGSSPPLPATVRALHFYREEVSAVPSLVDSRRIVLTHARPSQQLILFFFHVCK